MTTRKEKRVYKSVLALSMVAVFILAGVLPAMYAEAADDDGGVLFSDGGVISEDYSNLFWDNTTKWLGIGTSTPGHYLHVMGTQSEMIKISGSNYPQYIMESALGGAHEWSFFGAHTGWFLRDITNTANPFGVLNDAPHQSLVLYPTVLEVNHNANDYDFRVKSTSNANMLFVDASANAVGIGISNPDEELDVQGDVEVTGNYKYATAKTFYLNIPACAGSY